MGIQDRDYYRDESGGFLANWARQGQVVKTLIAVNIVVFVIQLVAMPNRGWLADHCVLIGERVLHGEVWRLVTYGFLHATDNLLHIILNMFVLYLFGREMEEHYGPREFLAFYLVGLIAAGLLYMGTAALGLNDSSLKTQVLGASGAVTAVMVLFAFHFPMRRVLLFGLIPMPVWLLVVLFVGIDLLGMLFHEAIEGERIAFAAHIGGAAFGALYYWRQLRLTAFWPRWPSSRVRRPRPRPSFSVDDDEPSYSPPAAPEPSARSGELDDQLESQVDAVLAKVAEKGQESLTTAERALLKRAGEVYRRRRK